MKYVALCFFIVTCFFISLAVGPSQLGFGDMWMWITHLANQSDVSKQFIFESLRLPRTMSSFFVGASLAVSGCLLQTLLQNVLAEPYTLGLSGGATVGAVGALLSGCQPEWLIIPSGAFLGCWLVTGFLIFLIHKLNFKKSRTLILIGVMISLFCGSFVTLFLALMEPNQLQKAFFWMMGQVGTPRDQWWPGQAFLFFCFFSLAFWNSKGLDKLLLGEEIGTSLGLSFRRMRFFIILLVAGLTSISVSIAGLMGFVGLLGPHMAQRFFSTTRHRHWLVSSALLGGTLLLVADIVGRVLGQDKEIPVGSLVAVIGAPILIFFLVSNEQSTRIG